MEQRVNVNFCVELQKSPTDQKSVREVENEEFSRAKGTTNVKTQIKKMLVCFFDISSIIHLESVPEGAAVNKTFYVQMLKRLSDAVRRKQREM
jgi:hypothetical protein